MLLLLTFSLEVSLKVNELVDDYRNRHSSVCCYTRKTHALSTIKKRRLRTHNSRLNVMIFFVSSGSFYFININKYLLTKSVLEMRGIKSGKDKKLYGTKMIMPQNSIKLKWFFAKFLSCFSIWCRRNGACIRAKYIGTSPS